MTTRYRTLLFFIVAAGWIGMQTQTATAQITLTAEDFAAQTGHSSSLSTYTSTNVAELQAIVDATGENQTYDFSQIAASDTLFGTVAYHDDPAGLPAAEDFPNSNYVMALHLGVETAEEDSSIWIFNQLTDDAIHTLGGAFIFDNPQSGEVDTLSFEYDPPRLNFPLPVTYGATWTDTTSFFGSGMTIESEVKGWGTLVTPAGSFDALRVRTVTTNSGFGFTSEDHTIDFITKTNEVSAHITLDSDGQTAVSGEVIVWTQSTSVSDDELPQRVRLGQNYPNPFNPTTTISFGLDAGRHARLTVHDMLGRTVAVLVDGLRPAGEHEVAFDASDLPSGTYVYRLETSVETRERVMMVVR